MLKITALYGHPTNPQEFEKYYEETHAQLARRMKGVVRWEVTRFVADPDGKRPAFYRMAELYFVSEAQMQETLRSPEGQATVADFANFASGGVTILIGSVEE